MEKPIKACRRIQPWLGAKEVKEAREAKEAW